MARKDKLYYRLQHLLKLNSLHQALRSNLAMHLLLLHLLVLHLQVQHLTGPQLVGATSYAVEYKSNASATWIIAAGATTATTFTLINLNSATLYDWRIKTNCSASVSGYTAAQFTTTSVSKQSFVPEVWISVPMNLLQPPKRFHLIPMSKVRSILPVMLIIFHLQ